MVAARRGPHLFLDSFLSSFVAPAVSGNEFLFAFFARLRVAVFHSDDHGVIFFGLVGREFIANVGKDIAIVDFPGEGLITAGIIAALEVRNF